MENQILNQKGGKYMNIIILDLDYVLTLTLNFNLFFL